MSTIVSVWTPEKRKCLNINFANVCWVSLFYHWAELALVETLRFCLFFFSVGLTRVYLWWQYENSCAEFQNPRTSWTMLWHRPKWPFPTCTHLPIRCILTNGKCSCWSRRGCCLVRERREALLGNVRKVWGGRASVKAAIVRNVWVDKSFT